MVLLVADQGEKEVPCPICQDEMEVGEILCRLPCGHCFHRPCAGAWLSRKATCPMYV